MPVRFPAGSLDPRPLQWLVPAALGSLLFTADLIGVESGVTTAPDRSLDLSLHSTFGPSSYGFFEVMSNLGADGVRLALVPLIFVALVIARYWWSAALTVVAVGGAALLDALFKLIVGRPRPQLFPHAVAAGGWSFPSGHTTVTCAFALVVIYLVWHLSQRRGLTGAVAVLMTAYMALVGLSRIVLGVHYPNDVLGGYALAGAWVALTIAFLAPALSAEISRASMRRYTRLDS